MGNGGIEHCQWGFIYPLHCAQTIWPCVHTKCASMRLLIVDCLYAYTYLYTHHCLACSHDNDDRDGMANDEQQGAVKKHLSQLCVSLSQ